MRELAIEIAGEALRLHAERALWWPRRRVLWLADVHFGKGSVLRRAGVSVPTGQTAADLDRLDALIAHFCPATLIVLGDLVHGAALPRAPWVAAVTAWRSRHAALPMRLVAGNHDRHFDARMLGFEVIHRQLAMAPFVLRHAPGPSEHGYVLAGHTHPGISLRDGWRRHRLPAFRFGDHVGVLPAFGSLTGLHEDSVRIAERIVAVTPAGLLDVSRQADQIVDRSR